MVKRGFGYIAACSLLFSPALAQAQNCPSLRSAYANADSIARALMDQNPGIRLIVFGCLSAAKDAPQSDIAKIFTTCGGGGCMLASGGYSNCITTGSRMMAYAIHALSLKEQMQRRGCAQ